MEHINSIIRTLCLVALLCLTSGNAFAYKVYDNGDINANLWNMENDKILVVTKDATVGNCYVAEGYALVILPGVTVEVTSNFNNQGTIYVFGKLYCVVGHISNNDGTINMIYPGKVEGEFMGSGTKNDNFNPFELFPQRHLPPPKTDGKNIGKQNLFVEMIHTLKVITSKITLTRRYLTLTHGRQATAS